MNVDIYNIYSFGVGLSLEHTWKADMPPRQLSFFAATLEKASQKDT